MADVETRSVEVRLDLGADEISFTFDQPSSELLDRFRGQASAFTYGYLQRDAALILAYADGLDVLRELVPLQRGWGFRFTFGDENSRSTIVSFIERLKTAQQGIASPIAMENLVDTLRDRGFVKRALKDHQLRDLGRLAAMPHGANFSVPGAGKTTVTLALHTVAMPIGSRMLVVAPKSAFTAWEEVVEACMDNSDQPFVRLAEDKAEVVRILKTGYPRLVVNYEMMVQVAPDIRRYLVSGESQLVMDESHRIKAGSSSLRGSTALAIGSAATRRDILSGTPMPQGAGDIAAQADFTWPGEGVGRAIRNGKMPNLALAGRFVRTTKKELLLPPRIEEFVPVEMNEAQSALYGILQEKTLAQLQAAYDSRSLPQARSAMYPLLQASVNPPLAAKAFQDYNAILDAAIKEGPSPKLLKVTELARANADAGRKTVIWTIFTDTLRTIRSMLVDLGAVAIYGGNSESAAGETTRDESIQRFTSASRESMVLVANPMAASEGLSLHEVCHEAIYVDRTYNAAHFLQSIDRIHRLGLTPDTTTRIQILQSVTPTGVGNIDLSVSRRLAIKARNLGNLLNDPDLAEIAMAEDDAPLPIDDSTDFEDIADLIAEIQGGKVRPPRTIRS